MLQSLPILPFLQLGKVYTTLVPEIVAIEPLVRQLTSETKGK